MILRSRTHHHLRRPDGLRINTLAIFLSSEYPASSRQFFSYGVAFSTVPYDFAENEFELDPQAASARGGGPPRKRTGIGVLDPPFPPKRPPGPIPAAPTSLLWRIAAALLLAGLVVMTFFVLFVVH